MTEHFKNFIITLSDEDYDVSKCLWDAKKHWTCTVKDAARHQMSFDVFGGSMTTMSPLEALYYFCSDAWDYINLDDASDLCNEFGYDYPVGKKIYKNLEKAYYKCRKFIGSENDIILLYEALEDTINN